MPLYRLKSSSGYMMMLKGDDIHVQLAVNIFRR